MFSYSYIYLFFLIMESSFQYFQYKIVTKKKKEN